MRLRVVHESDVPGACSIIVVAPAWHSRSLQQSLSEPVSLVEVMPSACQAAFFMPMTYQPGICLLVTVLFQVIVLCRWRAPSVPCTIQIAAKALRQFKSSRRVPPDLQSQSRAQ